MSSEPADSLIHAVARRLRWVSLGVNCDRGLRSGLLIAAVVLIFCRLTGLHNSFWAIFLPLIVVPAIAVVPVLLCWRQLRINDAARRVDQHLGVNDLFLTFAVLKSSVGGFQPLVAERAASEARNQSPAAVVVYEWRKPSGQMAALSLLGLLLFVLFPQFDPFGHQLIGSTIEKERTEFEDDQRTTEQRLAELAQQDDPTKPSPEIQHALDELTTKLGEMERSEVKENSQLLTEQQAKMGVLWRDASQRRNDQLAPRGAAPQQFGDEQFETLRKQAQELRQGKTNSLKQELTRLQDELQRLQKTTDPAERAETEQKLRDKMRELQDFASNQVNGPKLAAALDRARRQLERAKGPQFSDASLDAASRSLELAKGELEELAQSARDLAALEEALKTLQQARQLNDAGKLDGLSPGGEPGQCLADYTKLYEQLLAESQWSGEQSQGESPTGMRGEGTGTGGVAPESDSTEFAFKPEKSQSAITAGKVLLSLSTKDIGEKGKEVRDFQPQLQKVKQGVSEALLQEQIPPGYYDGIKTYFDSLGPRQPTAK